MGRIPYEHVVADDDVTRGVCEGSLRLNFENSSVHRRALTDIISSCWSLSPRDRPDFAQLKIAFNRLAEHWEMDVSECFGRGPEINYHGLSVPPTAALAPLTPSRSNDSMSMRLNSPVMSS